jgi:hypothetical protein
MTLFRKLAPGRLSRAIVALAGRSGNKRMQMPQPNLTEAPDRQVEADYGRVPLHNRTTITLETERLLIVRSERRSSGSSPKSHD